MVIAESRIPGMSAKAGWATPMFHVKSIEDSLNFYELLGFKTIDTDKCGDEPLGWARMHCEGGAIMFLRAEDDVVIDPGKQGVMLVMYTPDLPALREKLLANNVRVSAIERPPYMPSGRVCLRDPDGYFISVNHWGDKEHTAWLKRIGADEQKA